MRRFGLTMALVLAALAPSGCASPPPAAQAPPGVGQPGGSTGSGGGTFLSVIGTPFLIAFKIPFCAASVAVAAPLAGISALTPDDSGGLETRQALGAGLAQNCGPPYALTP